jgi:hypothetical protein
MNALALPTQGHTPLRAGLETSQSAKPQALLVNRATIEKGHPGQEANYEASIQLSSSRDPGTVIFSSKLIRDGMRRSMWMRK